MAGSTISITINTERQWDIGASVGQAALRKVQNLITSTLAGTGPSPSDWRVMTNQNGVSNLAGGLVGLGAVSGSVTITTNGTASTVTAGGGATATAAALTAAVNTGQAGRLVNARNYVAFAEFNNAQPGVKVQVCGFTFTGIDSNVSSPRTPYEFAVGVDDSDDADAFARAVSQAPGLNSKVVAVSDGASQVFIALQDDRLARPSEVLQSSDELTLSVGGFALRPWIVVFSLAPGLVGSAISLTATGTGMTAYTSRLITGEGEFSKLNDPTNRIITPDQR